MGPILRNGLFAIALVRSDQFDALGSKLRIERIIAVGAIPNKFFVIFLAAIT